MIPLKLSLRNFLPYRAPDDLRFDGIHLACLTGSNGAGKTSLLDAITWALWGEARAKRDEELIHQGQDDMHVILDFDQESTHYRVVRRRSRNKRSSTGSLDLFVIKSDGKPLLISEPGTRQTQEKINRLLRLDYDTFVHSAFLQQGRADAFTTQTPARRKQILGEILGLAQWEAYEEQVKAKLKEIERELTYCDMRITEINAEMARKPALLKEQQEASQHHADAQALLKKAQEQADAIKSAPEALKAAQAKRKELDRRRKEYQDDLNDVITKIERDERQIAEYDEVIAIGEEIDQGYTALQSARDRDQSLNAKLNNLIDLDQKRARLNVEWSAAQARLQGEIKSLQKSISEQEQIIETQPTALLESVQAEVDALRTVEEQRHSLQDQQNTLREQGASLKAQLKAIEAKGKELKDRFDRLQATDSPTCPLCGQPLSQEHREDLITQLDAELKAHREEYKECKNQINQADENLKEARKQFDGLEGNLKQLPTLLERVGKLQSQVDAAATASTRVVEENQQLQEYQTMLADDAFAPEVKDALALLDAEENLLAYDKDSHDEIRRTLEEFRQYEALKTQLAVALASLATLQENLEGLHVRQGRLEATLGEIDEEVVALEAETQELKIQSDEYARRELEVREQHTRERSAYERVVRVEQDLMALDAQAARREDLEKRREKYRYEEALYKELRTAFGRNGIPAMIIETAIPELEAAANELLGRMTDGRMSLRLMTQKDKVTGGVAETLDIEIADELGTRSYETYSGGEAFRINFAIRVALSQMLARRAGAQLRTLFIDEGFGTQDDSGRYKLVEAITAIQDQFDLILVITHIDELRDSFPVHVVVEKTSGGSRFAVR
jgi:DNA repair protein SbcC/Rad50